MTKQQEAAIARVCAHECLQRELVEALEGIVHFSDGFVCYHDAGPLGQELRKWIAGARAALARAKEQQS